MKKRLTDEQQRLIVIQLACFRSPTAIVEAVKEEFGIEISRQLVEHYDPTKGGAKKRVPERWKTLFNETRARYFENVGAYGIAHQAYRIEQLDFMEREARRMRNFTLAAQLHEQAAKEIGGAYTNRREHTGKDGTPLPPAPAAVIILPDNGRDRTR